MVGLVQIINITPKGGDVVDIIVDTLVNGESRIGIEHRLQPEQSVIESVNVGEEIRVRTL